MWNPVRTVLRSKSPRGIKVISLSLMLIFVSAIPYMLCRVFAPEHAGMVILSWVFAIGSLIAHLGFLWGILLLIVDMYFNKK